MLRRLPARLPGIIFIFVCTTVAWLILSATIFSRTGTADRNLRGKVSATWGAPQDAAPPTAQFGHNGPLGAPESTQAEAQIALEPRQKGLLWYSTYQVNFTGVYTFRNPSPSAEDVTFRMPVLAGSAIYDGLEFTFNGKPLEINITGNEMRATAALEAGSVAQLKISCRSQGLGTWRYKIDSGVARDFHLKVRTNFDDVDFADSALSPTTKHRSGEGWDLAWDYKSLVSGYQVAVVMPEKIQPGPLAGEISQFAPVSLFFFFFTLLLVTTVRKIDLHPMNYFFVAAAFFAFHLLLAYLVDHISIHWAFPICSAVSVFLVVNYLRLVAGLRFAALVAGGAQFVYLILFSYAFFFRGFTGLTVTIGAIVTLFLSMQLTAHFRWESNDSSLPAPPPVLT
jgi:inner membrane protein involved in colicin E2 resistance